MTIIIMQFGGHEEEWQLRVSFTPPHISKVYSIKNLVCFSMHLCMCSGHREEDVGIKMLLLEDMCSNPF